MNDAPHLAVSYVSDNLALIAPTCDLDLTTARDLRTRALDLIAQGHHHLIADLTGVTFCDSSGLNALIGIWRCATERGGSLNLAGVPGRMGRLLSLTGMDSVLICYPTADDAVEAHRARDGGPV